MEMNMERLNCRLVKVLLCVILWLPLMACRKDDPWYTTQPSCVIKGADPGRTGEYKAEGIKEFHNVVWNTVIENTDPDLDLLCYENKIFYGGKGYDEKTGKLIWKIPELQKYRFGESVIYKGHLYLNLYSYNQKQIPRYTYIGIADINIPTKEIKMLNTPLEAKKHSPENMLAINDMLFTNSGDDLFAYSLKTNQVVWHTATTKNSTGLLLTTDGERLFTRDQDRLAAYDIKTGKKQWIFDVRSMDIIYKDGVVYTDGIRGVWALNPKTGKVIWHYIPDSMDYYQFLPFEMRVNEKNVYVANENGFDKNFYVLDRLTGKLNFKIHGLINPLLHTDALYVDDYIIPYYEDYVNTIKVLDVKSQRLHPIHLPTSASYKFPKDKNLLLFKYDIDKKEVILTLIN
ncbi:MAG: hypothetical protein EPO11_08885 [Gammaproteobacteria bacterium]|nr:MAG: hypothetical protein EPO11_08885 [Gammaproteobacteria bacterium]